MWRRVQCEQPLDTGQSILRLRGNPIKLCGVFFLQRPQLWPKGNEVLIPQPGSGTVRALVPDVATRNESETSAGALGRVVFSA